MAQHSIGDGLSIRDLADHLEFVPQIARWHWGEWGDHMDPTDSEARWQELIASRSQRGSVPFTKLVLLSEVLVGTASVCWDDDDADFADQGPWLTGMFVQGPARNLGIGRALLGAVEAECRDLGFEDLWLHTGEAHRFYERCSWHVVRPRAYVGVDTVMRRTLAR